MTRYEGMLVIMRLLDAPLVSEWEPPWEPPVDRRSLAAERRRRVRGRFAKEDER
jgi:hypothetical protein